MLNCEEMVTLKTAQFDARITPEGIRPGSSPGLGITVNEGVLGDPVATWEA